MKKFSFWNRFARSPSPLIWLAGLLLIIAYAPPTYRFLGLAEGEHVVGFRGKSHEMVTVSGNLTRYPGHSVR
jgi:hypothetical protein